MPAAPALESLLTKLLTRFLRQNGQAVDPAQVAGVAARCAELVAEHGVPAPVRSEAESETTRLSKAELQARTALASGPATSEALEDATKQLVKALFYPELAECRGSFEAAKSDGRCKRQDPERARERLSGTHCVDCPHWRKGADEHAAFLSGRWRDGADVFEAHRGVFLPEEFRALRAWLRDRTR